ncbi:MAG: FG-GAP repeat protein, partial [bacterium]
MRMNQVVVCSVATLALAAAGTAHAQTLNDLYPELATLVASDGAAADFLGDAVALDGDTLAVGVPYDGVGANGDQGSVRVFVRSGTTWTLQATLTAADGAASDFFGAAVAITGDWIAVGAPGDDVGANSSQGSVRIFSRSGTVWTAAVTLTPGDGAASDNFGSALAYEYNTLVVGVSQDDVGANSSQGSVRVYTRNGGTWSSVTLLAPDGAAGDLFGYSVSISGDSIAIGVFSDTVGANGDQGSVRVFVRSGSSWVQQQSVVAADGAAEDGLGISVSILGDTLAVGASGDDVGANADQGSVRVFTRSGSTWSAQATVVPAANSAFGYFGVSVALGDDLLVAGSVSSTSGTPASNTGSAWVFARNQTTWTERVRLLASDGEASDFFGDALAIDGTTIAVGTPLDDVNGVGNQGSVRIFGVYRVFNDTTNVGFTSLADAIVGSSAGARLIVGAPAFNEATGIVDASQKRFNYVAVEPIAINANTLMNVATNTVFEKSPNVAAGGLTVAGDLSAPPAGTLTFEQLTVASGGQFLQRNSTILVNQNLATTSGGICYLQGPILAEAVTTAVGAQNRCAGDTDVFANYTNAGTTIVQRGILYIYGTLVNTGTLTGEVDTSFMPPAPGDGYSIGGDYVVSASSSLVLPSPIWWLRVGGDLDIAINSP